VLVEEAIQLSASAEELTAMHDALDRYWRAVERVLAQPPDERWRLQFATAVAEIGANIVRHAYPAGTPPGPVQLSLRMYIDRAEACFTDHGIVFVPPAESSGALDDDLAALREGGYGLAMVRAVVDQFAYARTPDGDNHWLLEKRL
jgi:serine/threonine-protein kinase RsbW